jgi:hypothetical protein
MGEAVRRIYFVLATVQGVTALYRKQLLTPGKFGKKRSHNFRRLGKK